MPAGYDTVVGSRGATISGGQQRRIAIARAIVRNAPILILDEPMTGLDSDSEERVSEGLRRLMDRTTCLLITHDLAAAADADQVIVLEHGRIVRCGPPRDVLRGTGEEANDPTSQRYSANGRRRIERLRNA